MQVLSGAKDFDLVAELDAEDGKRVCARRLLSLSVIAAPLGIIAGLVARC